jgi:hypothetical protein
LPLTEAILAAAAKKIFDVALDAGLVTASESVQRWLGREPTRRAFELALGRAYRTFARAHPQWVDALFDEMLLTGRAAPVLAPCLVGTTPDPGELANAWADGLGFEGPSRDRYVVDLMRPAAEFVGWLRAEMRMLPELRPVFDSRAWDDMASSLEEISSSSAESAEALRDLAANLTRVLEELRVYESRASEAAGLRDLIRPPTEVFDRVGLDQYIGRDWLESDLDRFLASVDRGAWILVGEAGVGKSTFLAHLVREHRYVQVFAEQVPGDHSLPAALESLSAQIVQRFRLEPFMTVNALPDALRGRPDFLRSLLWRVSEELGADERLVLVADGLDEAGVAPGQNPFGLPTHLPAGVFLVLSMRPVSVTLTISPEPRWVELRADDDGNRRDLREFLERSSYLEAVARQLDARGYTKEQFVASILERSAGNWMYVHYVLEEIRSGQRVPLDLAGLPSGLAGYFAAYWQRWRDRDDWHPVYAPVLTTLAAAFEPLTTTQLAEWSGAKVQRHALQRLLREHWRAFVHELPHGDSALARYRPYHATLREFLLGRVSTAGYSAARALVDELRERSREAHGRIADALAVAATEKADDAAAKQYARRHRTAHLREADRLEEVLALVDEPTWATAQLAADLTGVLWFRDLGEAHAAAHQIDARALAEGRPPPRLGDEMVYLLASAGLRSTSNSLPPALVRAAVEHGTWTLSEALDAIAQQTVPNRQVECVAAVAPLLELRAVRHDTMTAARRVLEFARDMPDQLASGRVVAAVAARLPAPSSPRRSPSPARSSMQRVARKHCRRSRQR